ncbi:DUF4258 domain-containing protein [bacterium]|nr:DUF4258 domain-containing protein [bacterium]
MQIEIIRELIKNKRVGFKKHAVIRMHQRNIKVDELEHVLLNAEIVEEYLSDKPLPSRLILGYTKNNRPLHILYAVDETEKWMWIITVYEPNRNEWKDGYKKRK